MCNKKCSQYKKQKSPAKKKKKDGRAKNWKAYSIMLVFQHTKNNIYMPVRKKNLTQKRSLRQKIYLKNIPKQWILSGKKAKKMLWV